MYLNFGAHAGEANTREFGDPALLKQVNHVTHCLGHCAVCYLWVEGGRHLDESPVSTQKASQTAAIKHGSRSLMILRSMSPFSVPLVGECHSELCGGGVGGMDVQYQIHGRCSWSNEIHAHAVKVGVGIGKWITFQCPLDV